MKILLIENDDVCIQSTTDILSKSDKPFELTSVCSLQAGIEYCSNKDDFDLALLDLKLPNGEGVEAFKNIYKICNKPIIVLSDENNDHHALQCMKLGAQDYIIKPVTHETLIRSIRYSIERYKLILEKESFFKSAPVGMGVLDYDNGRRTIIQVNDRFCEMLNYDRDYIIGKSARIVYPSQEEFERVGNIKYPLIEKTGIGTVETQWITKNNVILDILLSSVYINPNKNMGPVTFSGLDITDKKNMEKELKKRINQWKSDICSKINGTSKLEKLVNNGK